MKHNLRLSLSLLLLLLLLLLLRCPERLGPGPADLAVPESSAGEVLAVIKRKGLVACGGLYGQ